MRHYAQLRASASSRWAEGSVVGLIIAGSSVSAVAGSLAPLRLPPAPSGEVARLELSRLPVNRDFWTSVAPAAHAVDHLDLSPPAAESRRPAVVPTYVVAASATFDRPQPDEALEAVRSGNPENLVASGTAYSSPNAVVELAGPRPDEAYQLLTTATAAFAAQAVAVAGMADSADANSSSMRVDPLPALAAARPEAIAAAEASGAVVVSDAALARLAVAVDTGQAPGNARDGKAEWLPPLAPPVAAFFAELHDSARAAQPPAPAPDRQPVAQTSPAIALQAPTDKAPVKFARPATSAYEFKVVAQVRGAAAQPVSLLVDSHGSGLATDITVRLGDVLALVAPLMSKADYAALSSAASADEYVPFTTLRQAGIDLVFNAQDHLVLSAGG